MNLFLWFRPNIDISTESIAILQGDLHSPSNRMDFAPPLVVMVVIILCISTCVAILLSLCFWNQSRERIEQLQSLRQNTCTENTFGIIKCQCGCDRVKRIQCTECDYPTIGCIECQQQLWSCGCDDQADKTSSYSSTLSADHVTTVEDVDGRANAVSPIIECPMRTDNEELSPKKVHWSVPVISYEEKSVVVDSPHKQEPYGKREGETIKSGNIGKTQRQFLCSECQQDATHCRCGEQYDQSGSNVPPASNILVGEVEEQDIPEMRGVTMKEIAANERFGRFKWLREVHQQRESKEIDESTPKRSTRDALQKYIDVPITWREKFEKMKS